MTAMLFLGVWLASYRITRLITRDTIFEVPREWFFRKFPPTDEYARMTKVKTADGWSYWKHDTVARRPIRKWGELFHCPFCIGFWVAGATVLVVAHFDSVPLPILWWLATSTAIGLTAKNADA